LISKRLSVLREKEIDRRRERERERERESTLQQTLMLNKH